MYSPIGYHLAQAHLAGLHHQTQRDALAHAAHRARRAPPHPSTPAAPVFPAAALRRMLTALGARNR
jgi:hypothetical protein